MKTAREWSKEYWGAAWTTGDERAIAARDAEHRAELERLNGELAEAQRLLSQVARGTNAHPFCPGCGKVRNEEHGSWCPIAEFLAAPPPAESTPVPTLPCDHCRATTEVSGTYVEAVMCAACVAAGHSLRRKWQPAPPDDIRERLEQLEKLANRWLSGEGYQDDRLDDHERRLAALEAKGEPGTHAQDSDGHCRFVVDTGGKYYCGEPLSCQRHPKGAKP